MRKIFTTLFFCQLIVLLLASPGKGDDVTLEQLRSTEHHLESDAPAAYLINKAYNDEGEEYSEFEIRGYQSGGKRERIGSIKAFTYNDVGGKVEKVKLEKNDIFREETSENWNSTKFAMPKVKSGSIIDVKYTVTSPYYWILDRFYFQKFIPVDKGIYKIGVPEYFNMAPVPKGFVALETAESSNVSNGYSETVYTYTAGDVPSIEEDDYVLNINDYRGSVKYEISSYEFPGQGRQVVTGNWQALGKEMMSDGMSGAIGKHGKVLDPIVAGVKGETPEEKIQYIYNYVRDNFKWNGNYGVYASVKPKELMAKKVGNVGDINIMLINLLRKSGLPAHPVVTRARRSGILNMSFPSRSELNYVLVQTQYEGKPLLLDATSKYMQIGQLPIRAVNISGVVMHKETGGKAIEITNNNELNQKYVADYSIDLENEVVNGAYQVKLSKYGAIKYRQELDEKNEEVDEDNQDLDEEDDEYADEDDEEEEEEVQVDNEITVTSSKGMEDVDAPINYTYDEVNYKIMSLIGGEIFIDADFDLGIKKNPFTDEEREYPAFFNYKLNLTKVAKLKIPEGYDIKSLPENASLSLPGKLGKFRYVTAVKDGTLTVQYIFRINRDFFLPEQYPALKQMFNMVIAKQNEKIVLGKSGVQTTSETKED